MYLKNQLSVVNMAYESITVKQKAQSQTRTNKAKKGQSIKESVTLPKSKGEEQLQLQHCLLNLSKVQFKHDHTFMILFY